MRMRSLVLAGWMVALAIVLGLSPARADVVGTLVVGSATTIHAGSYEPSSWNGTPLEFLYCVDMYDYISAPGTYNATVATDTGVVTMSSPDMTLTEAGQVAWLLDNYGVGGRPETPQMIGLQEAIWQVIYGHGYGSPSSEAQAFRDQYFTALGTNTGNIGDYLWFSPKIAGQTGVKQALVGRLSVPEPTSVVLLGVFLLAGVLGFGAKRLA